MAEVSQWLGYAFFVFFVGSKSNASAGTYVLLAMFRAASVFVPEFVVLRWLRRSIAFFLGFAWWLKFRSGLGMLSLFFLWVPKATRRHFSGCAFVWLGCF